MVAGTRRARGTVAWRLCLGAVDKVMGGGWDGDGAADGVSYRAGCRGRGGAVDVVVLVVVVGIAVVAADTMEVLMESGGESGTSWPGTTAMDGGGTFSDPMARGSTRQATAPAGNGCSEDDGPNLMAGGCRG